MSDNRLLFHSWPSPPSSFAYREFVNKMSLMSSHAVEIAAADCNDL